MKKFTAVVTVALMVMSLCMTATAAGIQESGKSDTAKVTATYTAKEEKTVYQVDIAWEDLKFTYNEAYKGDWNPSTHQYGGATEAGWSEGNGEIIVTNHSNTAITATPSYEKGEGYESADMLFSTEILIVATADNGVDGAAGTETTGTITVTPSGSLPEGTKDAVIGTITITIQ